MITIKMVLDPFFKDVKFNKSLGKKFSRYILDYTHSDKGNLEFFSSNLLGIHPARYTDRQILMLFSDILDVDFLDIKDGLTTVDEINQNFKISSDVFNIVIVYCTHRFLTSSLLKDRERIEYAKITISIFYYRTLAVLVAHGFKFNANKAIVEAAYSNLNNKYLIKKLGSWNKVVQYRVDNIIDGKSKHFRTLTNFDDDSRILYIITDSQGSIKTLFQSYYSEIVKAKDNNEMLISASNTIDDVDGNEILRDKVGGVESDILKLLHLIPEERAFIRVELLSVIGDLNKNANITTVREFLVWISTNYSSGYGSKIEEFIRGILVYSNEYLTTQRSDIKFNDLSTMLITLRNVLVSSRNQDVLFLNNKKLYDKLIKGSKIKINNKNIYSANRTSVALYIILLNFMVNKSV